MSKRYFTLEEARQLLPWINQVFKILKEKIKETKLLTEEISDLQNKLLTNGRNVVEDKLDEASRNLKKESSQMEDKIREVEKHGILVKQISPGLVDFPHMTEGREIYLCWQESEEDILYWHEISEGFNGRQPL